MCVLYILSIYLYIDIMKYFLTYFKLNMLFLKSPPRQLSFSYVKLMPLLRVLVNQWKSQHPQSPVHIGEHQLSIILIPCLTQFCLCFLGIFGHRHLF